MRYGRNRDPVEPRKPHIPQLSGPLSRACGPACWGSAPVIPNALTSTSGHCTAHADIYHRAELISSSIAVVAVLSVFPVGLIVRGHSLPVRYGPSRVSNFDKSPRVLQLT